MRNIRVFDTMDEFIASQEAVSGTGEYVEDINPGFVYVRELYEQGESGVVYNKPKEEPVPEHDYVEIGGIKWATMNLGATAVTDFGKYYAWGDVNGYTADQVGVDKIFNNDNYVYGPIDWDEPAPDYGVTKYNSQDGLTELLAEDDAVAQEWGGNWRMPTAYEWNLLTESVNTAFTLDYNGSGVAGLICTDVNDSSKELFFPLAGYGYLDSVVENDAAEWPRIISFWSSTRHDSYIVESGYLHYYEDSENQYFNVIGMTRCFGLTIRGVFDDGSSPTPTPEPPLAH